MNNRDNIVYRDKFYTVIEIQVLSLSHSPTSHIATNSSLKVCHTHLRTMRTYVCMSNVTGFARRGLIRAPLQNTDFTTILWIHHQTIHVCMFCGQQLTSLLSPRLLSEPCQTAMNARFVLSRLCWQFNKGYQAVRSHTTLW